MLGRASLAVIILTSGLFISAVRFETNSANAQFFENSEGNGTSTSGLSSNSTSSQDTGSAEIVLLSQKLKKSSFGYRDLVGQVKNIGNESASSVQIHLTIYGKDGGVIGTDFTYADIDTLNQGQKSTFKIMASSDDFKGMDYYELSLEWSNEDGSQGYTENAQIYKDNSSKTDQSKIEN
jgi:hypothetical protein